MKQVQSNKRHYLLNATSKILLNLFILSFLGLETANAQVGIGTTSPDASAQLELQSTDKGFLPPRMDTDARDGIGSPAEGLTIYNTDNKCLEVFDSADWISICDGSVVTSPTPTLIGANGVVWMDRNLGANQVAQSSTDHLAYGDIYQWGRAADGHEKITWTSGTTGTSVNGTTITKADVPSDDLFITATTSPNDWRVNQDFNLWNGLNAVNNPCPAGFRIPTSEEITAEVSAYSISNSASAFASIFKFTVQGTRGHSDGNLDYIGSDGNYWSSSVNDSRATYRNFSLNNTASVNNNRALGFAVRCIKEVTAPDAPTSVEATGGDTQATVTFTAPASNGGATITGYTVTSSSGEILATGQNSPIIITGLTNGTAYTFTVTATNSAGLTSESAASNAVTPVAATQIGDFRDGGVVFYIFQNGDSGYVAEETHGLVCAIQDQSTGVQWYNGSYTTTGATTTGILSGQTNTTAIINNQGAGDYAAQICDNYSVTIGSTTYNDWFLPSKDELNLMFQNKATINATAEANGGSIFTNLYYWSSTESTSNLAWVQYFDDGDQVYGNKYDAYRVRAVRAF